SYLRVAFEVDARPDDDSFEAPDFAGFDILAGPTVATGRQTYWINGKQTVTESYTYTYVLMPQAKGTYTIGAARISVDGRSYTTKPLPVEVIDEGDQSESRSNRNNSSPEAHVAKDDIQLRIKLSSTSVYKGEAVRASIVLYTRTSIATINNVKLPTFEGFWSQELPAGEDSSSRAERDGKVDTTYLLKEYLLYPQQSGALRIDPAEL
ncbi:MAG: BatD family protein, partial [Alistipes sp.]|nr:BatD family protein [Alistipes sp.]